MLTGDVTPNALPAIMRAVKPRSLDRRQVGGGVMLERRRDLLRSRRQGDPALQAQHLLAARALHIRRPLGMGDAAPGRHQVHRAGLDFLDIALAVAVHDAAVEQIGDGGEPDMRMRANVHALAGHELHRPEMIEEDEGPDHLALAVRQRAAHLESVAEVAGARHDDQLERVAGQGIAEHGIVGGQPAHGNSVIFAAIIAGNLSGVVQVRDLLRRLRSSQ